MRSLRLQTDLLLALFHGLFGLLQADAAQRPVYLDRLDLVAELEKPVHIGGGLLALVWVDASLSQPLCLPVNASSDHQQD